MSLRDRTKLHLLDSYKIEKGQGEGSRGGHVVGHTSTGQAIYDSSKKKVQAKMLKLKDEANKIWNKIVDNPTGQKVRELEVQYKNVMSEYNTLKPMFQKSDCESIENEFDQIEKAISFRDAAMTLGVYIEKSEVDQALSDIKFIKNDAIEKGNISYALNSIPLTKTGKEIKEKIPTILAQYNAQLAVIIAQMSLLRETAGSEPTQEWSSGINRYSYEVMRGDQSYSNYEPTEAQQACSKYNDLCYDLRDCQSDIKIMNVLMNNLSDDKTYNFSPEQLANLGF